MEYNDGLKSIYLYTKGTVGHTSQKLRDMLRYIEESTQENAVNEDLRNIHRLVTEIKQDEEVELSYMKLWEIEARMRREGREEGREEGLKEGREEGLKEGREEGLKEGREEGLKGARTEGIKILAEAYKELGMKEEDAISKVADKYGISEKEVLGYLEKE